MLLAASFLQPPADFFEGHCFQGTDFISGSDGAREYEQATGRAIEPGADGCYCVILNRAKYIEIGVDARGSMKLYLYRKNGAWAVSTSLPLLVELLRNRGLRVPHRPAMLYPLGIDLNFTNQQVATQSIFEDIILVPSFQKIVIREGEATLETAYPERIDEPYEDALSNYISTWRERLRALLGDPRSTVSADLTGGQDSRVCFAFAHSTGLLATSTPRARLASNVRQLGDFGVAESIASRYGYTLNTKGAPPSGKNSGERAFSRWRENSMGTYLPVYLKGLKREPLRLHIHGAGGGNFRPVYGAGNLKSKLDVYESRMPPALYDEFRTTTIESMQQLTQMRPAVRELSLHYREFRNRFHFGFFPQCETLITPLNSVLLDRVTDRPGIDANRVYADVMDSLVPGLKSMPYDVPSKNLPRTDPSAASKIARSAVAPEGRIFAAADPEIPYASGERAIWRWLDHSEASLEHIRNEGYLTSEGWNEARDGLVLMRKNGKMDSSSSRPVKMLSFASAASFAINC